MQSSNGELPAARVLIRSMLVNAMKGNVGSQRILIELITQFERSIPVPKPYVLYDLSALYDAEVIQLRELLQKATVVVEDG